jgi:hypothetical protein
MSFSSHRFEYDAFTSMMTEWRPCQAIVIEQAENLVNSRLAD